MSDWSCRTAAARRSSDLTTRAPRAVNDGWFSLEEIITDALWCLFLDVDGTLLELATTPDGVRVEPALRELLDRVNSALGGAVALVSGRNIAEIDRLFDPQRWPAAGVHGLERRDATGRWLVAETVDSEAVAIARDRLKELSARLPGTLVEDKGLAVALHYRLTPHLEHELRRESRAIAREIGADLRLLEGRMVLELRPGGATKADAIRSFLAEPPFAGRRPIFMGDDITDEEGLAAVERIGGLSVAVGDRVQGMVRVAGPRDVHQFLEELAESGVPAQ
jgi:trehalose 6-phosphate phosphatase